MAVLKPRERLVYFRISEDEFRQFVGVCEQAGARSVSDLARSAVQRLIADGDRQREGDELALRMNRLEKLIAAVTEQLQLLTTAHTNGGGMRDSDSNAAGASSPAAADNPHRKEQ